MLSNLINQLNTDFNLVLNPSDYSGYLIKKITTSTTIAISKPGNQYHIDITDTSGAMKMFPVVISSENLTSYDSSRKKDFNLKLGLSIYKKNLQSLLGDLQLRTTSAAKTLRNTTANLTSELSSIFSSTDVEDSFTYITHAKRSSGQHQLEVGTSADGQAFLLLRALLIPDDYLIFLKENGQIKYSVFGIQAQLFTSKYVPIVGTTLHEVPSDLTPITSHLISLRSVEELSGLNQIFFGPPGTGKSTVVNQIIDKKINYRTTFHPDTDYNSFVGGYKPTAKADGTITYSFVAQIFTKAYLHAWENPDINVFLVIEEINRGNCAQIFGDIFQLLDRKPNGYSDYSISVDSEMEQYLSDYFSDPSKTTQRDMYVDKLKDEYDATGFSKIAIPRNLILLATMNTSDQSLFPMDSAFKRRWDWEYVPINYEQASEIKIRLEDAAEYNWGEFIETINKEILSNTHSEDKQIGNWFVKPVDKIVSFLLFRSKVMFYLWTELSKDEYQTDRNLFKFKSDDGSILDFTFNDLFTGYNDANGTLNPMELMKRFLAYHNIQPI